jgi:hypothetical protein
LVCSSKALIERMPGMKNRKRPVRLHWRCWYSRQASGFAQAAVVLADHGLAPAEEADRAPARLVDRHRGMAHAVAHPAIGRVLRPVVLLVRTPGRQFVRHHGLPVVGGEHHREAVQAPAFAPILAIGVQNLPGDFGIGKVLRPHGEPRHVARHQRRLEVGQGFGDGALDLLEGLARGHALVVDGLGLGLSGGLLGEHFDAGADLAAGRNAGGALPQQGRARRCRRPARR